MMKSPKAEKAFCTFYIALLIASLVASLATSNYSAAIGWVCCLVWFLQSRSWQQLCSDTLKTIDVWKEICDDYSESTNRWRKLCDDYAEIAKIKTEELNIAENDAD